MAPIRRRVALLIALLVPLNTYALLSLQIVRNQGYASMLSLFFNVVFALFLLALANRAITWVAPRQALTQIELLAVYVALAIGTAVAQFVEYLVPLLAGPFRLANADAGTLSTLTAPLARWLTVRDADAVQAVALGRESLLAHLGPWAVPFLGWTLFAAVLLATSGCIAALFYPSWVGRERLPFPIVQIPLQLTAGGGGELFRSGLFWVGFGVAGGLTLWNGIAALLPTVPALAIKRQGYEGFQEGGGPLGALGTVYWSLHPFVIGLGYLLPLDLTFSIGAFHWLNQGVRLGAASAGWGADNPRFPYVDMQSFGAWMALFGFAVWYAARRERTADVRPTTNDQRPTRRMGWSIGDLQSPRRPVPDVGRWSLVVGRRSVATRQAIGMVAGFLVLCLFGVGLGLPWWASLAFFSIYLALTTAMTRARAELGPPAVDLFFAAPAPALVALFGGKLLGAPALLAMALLYWLWLEYPWHPMGHLVEARRIGDETGRLLGQGNPATGRRGETAGPVLSPRRPVAPGAERRVALSPFWLAWPALLAWTSAFLVVLHLDITLGAATARQAGTQAFYTRQAFDAARGWIGAMAPPDLGSIVAMTVGGGVASLLSLARLHVLNWPLHPVGYALGSAFTTGYLWLPLWIACLAKGLIVRYGGLATYRRFMPLFLGLVLGEFVIGSAWALLGVATGWPTYLFWPY
jgi:hypothetical protein